MDWTVVVAGAAGAAVIKLIDNVIQFVLNRRAKKEDTAVKEKTDIEKRVDEIADCVAIISIDRLEDKCKQAIHNQEISLHDRQRIHAMYKKAHTIGVNGDLEDLFALVAGLPLTDPLSEQEEETI